MSTDPMNGVVTLKREGSGELLETRLLTISSTDFGSAQITERQFTLRNEAPAELM